VKKRSTVVQPQTPTNEQMDIRQAALPEIELLNNNQKPAYPYEFRVQVATNLLFKVMEEPCCRLTSLNEHYERNPHVEQLLKKIL